MSSTKRRQRSFTPSEMKRLQAAYDAVIGRVGLKAPLGLKEAIAAELLATASPNETPDQRELLLRIEYFLDDRYV